MSTSLTTAMARRIEIWPAERLVPYAKNARTHSPEQVAQIAASIAEFGFNAPILVDSNAGIIAGHGRLLAARKLGLDEVPVVVLDHLTETQRRAYIIADNKLAINAGWDEKSLAAELRDLEDEGVDLALVGFSDDELQDLLADPETPQSAPDADDEVPEEPANPVSRPGDLWAIGPHRLICGDCRDLAVVLKLLDDARASVCITSPPYATQREYDSSSGFKPIHPDEYVAWYKDVATNIRSALADDGSYFLNIKEHADEGERHLYVNDPGTLEDAISILPADMPPTVTVATGNGAQALWVFKEPLTLETEEERRDAISVLNRWHTMIRYRCAARGWAYDRLSDLARVARVPGTVNMKDPADPKPVAVIATNSQRRYNLSEFEEYVEDAGIPDDEARERAARVRGTVQGQGARHQSGRAHPAGIAGRVDGPEEQRSPDGKPIPQYVGTAAA